MVFEPWIGAATIHTRTAQLVGHLATRFGGEPVRIIPVLRGAHEFSNLLTDMLAASPNAPSSITVDPIRVKSYAGTASRELRWLQYPSQAANPLVHDVLVEDIADSARTLTAVEAALGAQAAASLTTVVMLNRPAARAPETVGYQPSLVGFELDDPNAWAIGFGLDLDEQYRDLPDIYGRLGPTGQTPPPFRIPELS